MKYFTVFLFKGYIVWGLVTRVLVLSTNIGVGKVTKLGGLYTRVLAYTRDFTVFKMIVEKSILSYVRQYNYLVFRSRSSFTVYIRNSLAIQIIKYTFITNNFIPYFNISLYFFNISFLYFVTCYASRVQVG